MDTSATTPRLLRAKGKLALLALLLLSPLSARGENPALVEATRLYESLDYDGAKGQLAEALTMAGNRPEDLARIYWLLGAIQAATGAYKESLNAYKRIFVFSPDFQPTARLSPKVMEPFDDAREFWKGKPRLDLRHKALGKVEAGKAVAMKVWVENDHLEMVTGFRLSYRLGGSPYQEASAAGREVTMEIPAGLMVEGAPVEYHVDALDRSGGVVMEAGKADMPFRLMVGMGEGDEVADSAAGAWYKQWWVWTIVGAVVAGTTATILGVTLSGEDKVDYVITYKTLGQ